MNVSSVWFAAGCVCDVGTPRWMPQDSVLCPDIWVWVAWEPTRAVEVNDTSPTAIILITSWIWEHKRVKRNMRFVFSLKLRQSLSLFIFHLNNCRPELHDTWMSWTWTRWWREVTNNDNLSWLPYKSCEFKSCWLSRNNKTAAVRSWITDDVTAKHRVGCFLVHRGYKM